MNIVTFLGVVSVTLFAYKYRKSRLLTKVSAMPPFIFGILGFLFMSINILLPYILAGNGVSGVITIIVQIVLVLLVLFFVFFKIYNENTTTRHVVSLIIGTLLFFILLAVFQGLGWVENLDDTKGMHIVGIIILILLMIWSYSVLKKEKNV